MGFRGRDELPDVAAVAAQDSPQSVGYEFWVVVVLGLAYGFAFYDRQMMTFLAPFVIPEFHLSNLQVGALGSGLSLTWAAGAYGFGRWSDRAGVRKPFLLAAMVVFSACSVLSGLSTGFWPLLASRMIMGAVEGPFLPICLAIVAATSPARRRGLNSGLVQNLFGSVLGAAVAPLASVAIAQAFGWRASFFTAALPGLILALVIWRGVREPRRTAASAGSPPEAALSLGYMLRQRNVALCGAIGCLAVGSALLVSIFMPVYLVSVRHYSPTAMSSTMAILGLTPPIGGVLVPWLSDRYGRRPPMIAFTALMALTPVAALLYQGPAAGLTALLFIGWLGIGTFPLFMAVVPAETLAFRSTATAMGLVVAMGEIFGGVLAPLVGGRVADSLGLAAPLVMATAMSLIAGGVAVALRETHPGRAAA